MLAFHNNPELKEKYIKRVKAHYDADEIIQGACWENGKGGAIDCTMEIDDDDVSVHEEMEKALGIPRSLVYLEDRLFKGLKNKEAKIFPLRFLDAIKVGSDLSLISPKFVFWLLTEKEGLIKYASPERKRAIKQVARLFKKLISGKTVTTEEWLAAVAGAEAKLAELSAEEASGGRWLVSRAATSAAEWFGEKEADSERLFIRKAAGAETSNEEYQEKIVKRYAAYKKMADRLIELLEEEVTKN